MAVTMLTGEEMTALVNDLRARRTMIGNTHAQLAAQEHDLRCRMALALDRCSTDFERDALLKGIWKD